MSLKGVVRVNEYPITSYTCSGCGFEGKAEKRFINCGGCDFPLEVPPSKNSRVKVIALIHRKKKHNS